MNCKDSFLFRVGLNYGEEVHQLVKNFNKRRGYLRQQLEWDEQDGKDKQINKNASSWSSVEVKYLVRWFEVAQEIQPSGSSPSKSVAMLASMSFVHP